MRPTKTKFSLSGSVILLLLMSFMQLACSDKSENKSVDWDITISNGDYNQPVSAVAISFNGNKLQLSEQIDAPMEELNRANFAAKGIPETALTACAGFWAGYEQVIYIDSVNSDLQAVLLTYEEGFDTPQKSVLLTF